MLDINKIKNFLKKREEETKRKKQHERDEIIKRIKALSSLFDKYFPIKRVYLYGSYADMSFHEHSDIDIAIDPDIEFEDALRLYTEIDKYFRKELDLRSLKYLPFPEKIKKYGIVVYERKDSYTQK
jgi:predicted nucleotidyltransferase